MKMRQAENQTIIDYGSRLRVKAFQIMGHQRSTVDASYGSGHANRSNGSRKREEGKHNNWQWWLLYHHELWGSKDLSFAKNRKWNRPIDATWKVDDLISIIDNEIGKDKMWAERGRWNSHK